MDSCESKNLAARINQESWSKTPPSIGSKPFLKQAAISTKSKYPDSMFFCGQCLISNRPVNPQDSQPVSSHCGQTTKAGSNSLGQSRQTLGEQSPQSLPVRINAISRIFFYPHSKESFRPKSSPLIVVLR